MSCLLWPVPVGELPRQTAAIAVASGILRDSLVRVTTDAFKKTIDPQMSIFRDAVQRDFAFVVMLNAFSPTVSGPFTDAIMQTAEKFSGTGVPEAEFNRLRNQVRQQRAAELEDNQWWLNNVLWGAQTHPQLVAEAMEHLSAIDALQASDVNSAAKIFSSRQATAIVLTGSQPEKASTPR